MTTRIAAGLLLGVAILTGFVVCVREAESDAVTRAGADVNGDGQVNVVDLLNVALCFGEVSEEPCTTTTDTPTSTPTEPASATPTSTITPTPTTITLTPTFTPTSTSTSYSVENLIYDSTGPHEGCLSRDPDRGVAGYDWQNGAVQRGTPTASHLTPWWQLTIDHCPDGVYDATPPIPAGAVTLSNFRAYALANGAWVPIGQGPQLGQWGNYTIGFRGSCFSGWTAIGHSYDPGSDPVCIAHGWVYPRSLKPTGYQCFVVLIESAGAGFLVNVGMDQYNGESYAGDVGIGRFVETGGTVGVTSCDEALLTSQPPPLP